MKTEFTQLNLHGQFVLFYVLNFRKEVIKIKKKNKAFTLIELIAVLVILAIIALIVTPLVMNIVKKVKDSANKRSVDGYGRAVELAIATYLLEHHNYPTNLDDLTVEYTGNKVVCNIQTLNEDGSVYLSECSVSGTEVKDSSTSDGWYHYGKYDGNGSDDLEAPGFSQEYKVGDEVTYNGIKFYVIKDSDETSSKVTLLKAEPLTVDEVNTYGGVGTDNNHVNIFATPDTDESYYQASKDISGYGGMSYYTSLTCGYDGSNWVYDGCTTDYEKSEVKYVIDAWTIDKILAGDLVEDETGYSARLLTIEDLTTNLGYVKEDGATYMNLNIGNTPSWVYDENYYYWTMSSYEDSTSDMWYVNNDGFVSCATVDNYNYVVRPVVTILKSAINNE